MNRDEKLKTFKWIKLKHSIRFVYLNLPFDIDSFKEFYLQNQYFLDGRTLEEMHKEFTYFQFIDLCRKWMVYPCLSKKEIIDFYEEEMKMLMITD
jgi:hypothetical protein